MSDTAYTCNAGDRAFSLFYQLTDSAGALLDLTGATNPRFSMTLRGAAARKVDNQPAVIANGTYNIPGVGAAVVYTPASGVLIYAWQAGDTDVPGVFDGAFSAQLSSLPFTGPSYGRVHITISPVV